MADILNSIRTRTKRLGIGTADKHFRAIQGCFGGGFCPTKLFESANPDEWQRALKEAESRLVYSGPGMVVKDTATSGSALTAGAVMDFDCIITTTRRDRDRDILETKGAIPDTSMPLLWQHIPMQPIGKLVSITGHSSTKLSGRFAIADTELGRDAAVLTEFGALRISHGFEPLEFEPLDDKEGGWRISKFHVLETSVVSIPSNVDAVITAFSRGKLHSPLIKGWAAKKSEKGSKDRPVQGIGFTPAARVNDNVDYYTNHHIQIQGKREDLLNPDYLLAGVKEALAAGDKHWDEMLASTKAAFEITKKQLAEINCGCKSKKEDDAEERKPLMCPKCHFKGEASEFEGHTDESGDKSLDVLQNNYFQALSAAEDVLAVKSAIASMERLASALARNQEHHEWSPAIGTLL